MEVQIKGAPEQAPQQRKGSWFWGVLTVIVVLALVGAVLSRVAIDYGWYTPEWMKAALTPVVTVQPLPTTAPRAPAVQQAAPTPAPPTALPEGIVPGPAAPAVQSDPAVPAPVVGPNQMRRLRSKRERRSVSRGGGTSRGRTPGLAVAGREGISANIAPCCAPRG